MPVYPEIWDGPARNYRRDKDGNPVLSHKKYPTIHNTSNDATAEGEASYAKRRTDGTSSHYYCLVPETRILYGDLTWRPIGEAEVGDRLIGIDEHPRPGATARLLVDSTVEAVGRRVAECFEVELEDGRAITCTGDHPWLAHRVQSSDGSRRSRLSIRPLDRNMKSRKGYNWAMVAELAVGDRLLAPFRPWDFDESRTGGYLAALFDGEGCISNAGRCLTFAQREGDVLDAGKQMLADKGLQFFANPSRRNGVTVVALSGLQSNLEFLGSIRPLRFDARRIWHERSVKSRLYPNNLTIRSIRPVGLREVVAVKTSSRTFFAEGVASHNCDNNSIVQSLNTDWCAGHVGSYQGNTFGISYEITGFNSWSRERWLSDVAWDLLAKQMARDCAHFGIPARLLTITEMRAGDVAGFITHDMARLAWGGTTHTDPGPNFPMDHLLALVRERLGPVSRGAPKMFFLQVKGEQAVYISDGMNTRHVPGGQWDLTCKPLIAAGAPWFPDYPSLESLLHAGGPLVTEAKPLPVTDEQLAKLADLIAARVPVPPSVAQIAKAVLDEDHKRSAA